MTSKQTKLRMAALLAAVSMLAASFPVLAEETDENVTIDIQTGITDVTEMPEVSDETEFTADPEPAAESEPAAVYEPAGEAAAEIRPAAEPEAATEPEPAAEPATADAGEPAGEAEPAAETESPAGPEPAAEPADEAEAFEEPEEYEDFEDILIEEFDEFEDGDGGYMDPDALAPFDAIANAEPEAFSGSAEIILRNTGTIRPGDRITLQAVLRNVNTDCRIVWEANDADNRGWFEIGNGTEYSYTLTAENMAREYRVVLLTTN